MEMNGIAKKEAVESGRSPTLIGGIPLDKIFNLSTSQSLFEKVHQHVH